MWEGHRLGSGHSGLDRNREFKDKVNNAYPYDRLAHVQMELMRQQGLLESDCWVDSVHPTFGFASRLVSYAMTKKPWEDESDNALLIVICDGWNSTQDFDFEFR